MTDPLDGAARAMTVTISGVLNEATLARAFNVHFAGPRLVGIALLIMSIVAVAITPQRVWQAVIGVGVGVVLAAFPFLVRRCGRRVTQVRTEAVASQTGIRFLDGNATSEYAWTSFHQAKVLPDLVILYRSSANYHILSPNLFDTADDWHIFVSWVRSSVPRPHRSGSLPT
jgi:hypothetical protein